MVNRFGATVNWEPPKFDGGSEITAYVIELRDRTSVKWEAALVCGASDRSATLNDVVEHKEYIFRVRAENKAGIGRPSAATNPVKIMDPIGEWIVRMFGLFLYRNLKSILVRTEFGTKKIIQHSA